MCQTIPAEGDDAASENRKSEPGSTDNVLTTQVSDSAVLLQTLNVRVKHGTREKIVRAVIDTGSERTYISKDIINNLNYKSCDEVTLIHKLFGGIETNETRHSKYKVHISSVDNHYNCQIYCLDTSVICSNVRKVPNGPWLTELNKYGIRVTDIENVQGVENEIKLLIGSDVAGKLFTGNVKSLKSGPVAVQTRLGWTLMGKISGVNPETNYSLLVISSLWNESSIANLWKLDDIGITDPVESKSKSEMHEESMQYFKNTVKVESSGRYEITLPWVLDNSRLLDNRELAEKRLTTMPRKLSNSNKTEVYNEIFDTWLEQGIIEVVIDDKESQVHYLPHRPVFKEPSETTKVRLVNPANLPSGGCSAEQFLQLKWWEGPMWLTKPESVWPQDVESPDEDVVNAEKRKDVITVFNKSIEPDDWYYRRISSYMKIVRLIAWILRFINNSRNVDSKEVSDLKYLELEQAERKLMILIQKHSFNKQDDEKIRGLRPVMGEDGVIRVKTQVIYREDTVNFKYPIEKLYHLEIAKGDSYDAILRTRSGRVVTVPKRHKSA